jgi:protein SCO1/2
VITPVNSVPGKSWDCVTLCFGFAILLTALGCVPNTSFRGTELTSKNTAYPFTLKDQLGQTVNSDIFNGKITVLTFLYTECTDICPLTTTALHRAYDMLGDDAHKTTFVAITVDPDRDNAQAMYSYSKKWDMLDKWVFLTGTKEELRPIWQAYYIALGPSDHLSSKSTSKDTADSKISAAIRTVGYLLDHPAPVYLIDRNGKMRVVFTDLALDPNPLVHDIRLLL